ncbi:hypothetical protein DH2020_034112 [Rehmannia glutinosa]|uniref:Bulb-type lectin domain-containing protein n=1 Tax=Rehmannia glutinosa TaxID=99300 RepID=A0ABR0VAT0_REHGL
MCSLRITVVVLPRLLLTEKIDRRRESQGVSSPLLVGRIRQRRSNVAANSPVTKDAILEFQTNGDLVLKDRSTTVWASNTSTFGVETASMSENGNFILYGPNQHIAWQSFSDPSDTLLPGQPLTVFTELKSSIHRHTRWILHWVPEWAVSKPCDIAGICGNGICNLDRIIANYSDIETVSKCGDACLSDCDCVASVYGLNEEKAYCWVLRDLDFGGYEDPGSTLWIWQCIQGSLSDGTLIAVKKLDRVLPHGEKEFITEVNTISSMHHMNLVRLLWILLGGHTKAPSLRVHEKRVVGQVDISSICYGMLLLEIIGGRRNLDMTYDAEDFFYPGWAFKGTNEWDTDKVADRRLEGSVVEEELVRALKVAFWCIQDEIGTTDNG